MENKTWRLAFPGRTHVSFDRWTDTEVYQENRLTLNKRFHRISYERLSKQLRLSIYRTQIRQTGENM